MPTPPAVVTPGNLYVDLATLTLWLGVDPSVEPAGAVLISDIIETTQEIVDAIATSEAYTDVQVATKANLVHTHLAANITDFNAAVLAVIASSPVAGIPIGLIAQYSGSIANIGVGDYANWHLCDGLAGTPDLRDKFVIGAGFVAVGTVNPSATAATTAAGAFTPVIQATTLTAAQMPAHVHGVNLSDSISGTTSSAGTHGHTVDVSHNTGVFAIGGGGPPSANSDNTGASILYSTSSAGAHTHTWSATASIVGNTASAGSGGSHTHIANAVPSHSHTISSTNLKNAIPWYAVAFIMKVS